MIPSALSGVLYSRNSVFLTMPFFVAKTRYFASLKSRVAITARISSSWRSGSRFTIARPFDCREPSGSSCTLSRYTLPTVVKKRMKSCVDATKRCSM